MRGLSCKYSRKAPGLQNSVSIALLACTVLILCLSKSKALQSVWQSCTSTFHQPVVVREDTGSCSQDRERALACVRVTFLRYNARRCSVEANTSSSPSSQSYVPMPCILPHILLSPMSHVMGT